MSQKENLTPEKISRLAIDDQLMQAGWIVQDKNKLDWTKGIGIALREYQTEVGPADYALFVEKRPVGIIEAKPFEHGHKLTEVEEQTKGYADSKLKHLKNPPLPFRYEATGAITRFTDIRDPKPRSRIIFNFHRPETLRAMLLEEKSLRGRFHDLPALQASRLRGCQFRAISNLEKSFKESRPRALIQMATGAGKTFTAISFVYRLLKHCKAKRVLFLVDTKNLGEQAEQEFMAYTPPDDNRKFTELYNVVRLKSPTIPSDCQVYISTIQRLYSVLLGRDIDESLEQENPNEKFELLKPESEVVYNGKVPIEFFDFIVIDEAHRSIYNLWKQVLDYFDAFLIGLTATPDKRTFGFFNENIVSEYSHQDAVADGVNVGFEIYRIKTKIGSDGNTIEAEEFVDKRERKSRRTRWEMLDEDVVYASKDLDRDVVNLSQIRTIIKTFRQKLPELFPGRSEPPKTLIFAKTDSHADDIINITREEFGEGNEFCKKITYQSEEDPKSVLSQFRKDYNPRVAVTVDMIATGTDVKSIECLIFMRDVKSSNYYVQMLGRGTRVLSKEDLVQVTPSAKSAKTHFVVIDAVGVSESCKTDARPLERKRTTPIKDLLSAVLMGNTDEDVFSSLAGRISRLAKELDPDETNRFVQLAKGHSPSDLANALLAAHDPDAIEDHARQRFKIKSGAEPASEQMEAAQSELLAAPATILNGELNTFIDELRRSKEQILDPNLDSLVQAGWGKDHQKAAENQVSEFTKFIEDNKNEITALKILYNEPQRRKDITYAMIKEVFDALKQSKPNLAPLRVWEAYANLDKVKTGSPKTELTAIVSLIRRVTGVDSSIIDYDRRVDKNFQDWVFKKQSGAVKFNKDQMDWLRMIKEHVSTSFHLDRDDLEMSPFDARGGLAKMYELFGADMETIISEMNEALVA